MRLRRIEAVRYGSLRDEALGDFGDGLTVVVGPNESGKSTFTSLVRDVLYGFRRKTDPSSYWTESGRHGRLHLEARDGSWIIERVEGTHGGRVTVHTVSGPDRAALLDEVRGTVDENMFRVVLGFGLDELPHVEGSGDALTAGLQAAGAGLAVSPVSVLGEIAKHADSLYAERASTRKINSIAKRIREARETIRGLEQTARDSVADEARADVLEREAEEAKQASAELEASLSSLQRAVDRLASIEDELREKDEMASEARSSARQLDEDLAALVVEDGLLAARARLEPVLDEVSGFREVLEGLRDKREKLAQTTRALERDFTDLPERDPPPGFEEIISRHENESVRLRAEIANAEKMAHQADARARQAAEAASVAAPGPASGATRRWPAYAALSLGVLAALAGALSAEWLTAAFGIAVIALGVAMFLHAARGSAPLPITADRARLADEEFRARGDAEAARASVESLRQEEQAAQAGWRQALSSYGLLALGEDPSVVRAQLARARDRSRVRERLAEQTAAVALDENRASAWVTRLRESLRGVEELPADVSFDDALAMALRVRQRLEVALGQALVRDELSARSRSELSRATEAAASGARLRAEVVAIAGGFSVPVEGAREALETLLERARADLGETRERLEEASTQAASLRGSLREAERDTALAHHRQLLEGLAMEARALVEEYAAYAVARHMLEQAKDVYERTRRPDRERIASEVYESMTLGRYTDLRMPMEAAHFEVFDTLSGRRKKTSELSRGAAEQLYLALRVGFITQLSEAGCSLPVLMDDVVVNFDPERRTGAAQAVARLAADRQVIFFTCHPETADVLGEAVGDHVRIELDRV